MQFIRRILHHFINPHCPICEMKAQCKVCETVKVQNDILRAQNQQLLDVILNFYKPVQMVEKEIRAVEPIRRGSLPWHMKAKILEQDERAKARIEIPTPDTTETIEELEKELGITNEDIKGTDNRAS